MTIPHPAGPPATRTGRTRRRLRSVAALGLSAALALTGFGVVQVGAAPPAVADTAPPAGVPRTPSADSLPTTQIDGVVWQQGVVGNHVYAGGEFSTARPAGAAAGVNTVSRPNLLRYDIRTGVLDAGWNPAPNGQVRAVAVSPDGQRVYVGGNFTTIAGANRYRIAAFDTSTGALITSFNAGTNSQVRAIVATNTTVYVGGIFTQAGTQARTKLAAFRASDGAVLPWAPTVDNGSVSAITISPDGSSVVVGGSFTSFNGSSANGYGLARVNATSGATEALPANSLIRNGTNDGAILGLTSDDTSFYGVGYTWGRSGGTLEGVFRASWATGQVTWVFDCHGDSYAVYAAEDVVYSASHYHYCGNVRSIPQTPVWEFYRANAMTKDVRQTVGREHLGYTNFEGQGAPEHLYWSPDFDTGVYTGQNQGPWAVSGNDEYVVWGGEFRNVNFRRQQGLARFAITTAPNEEGPRLSGAEFTPQVRAVGDGAVRISWAANVDFDNEFLTYRVIRDGNTATPVWTGQRGSTRWNTPWMGATDTGRTPGATHSYRVSVTDPFGNTVTSPTVQVTVDSGRDLSPYAQRVLADGVSHYWRLGEASGTTARDSAAINDASTGTAMTRGVPGAIEGDADTAFRLTDSSSSRIIAATQVQGQATHTVEAWIRTTSSRGGRIVGLSQSASLTGTSSNRDRHLYMDNQGRVLFGVSPGQNRSIQSAAGLNDGEWHHVVGTLGPNGVALFVDGVRVAQNTGWTTARNFAGYWRIGGDSLAGWANAPSTINFTGDVDEVAVYPVLLTPEQIAAHHALGTSGVAPNVPPTASFTSTEDALQVAFDASGSSDGDGTIASYEWSFGDGQNGLGRTPTHTYATPGTYTVTLTVTDDDGATGTTSAQVTVEEAPNQAPDASFTATPSGLGVSVDAAASDDPDGSIASYAWEFGDGGTASGETATHTYAAPGTYTITLTVTDDDDATGTTTRQVAVSNPGGTELYASDTFSRTVAGGWGVADTGGPWTLTGGTAPFSVDGSAGVMRLTNPGWYAGATLGEVSRTTNELQATLSIDKLGSGGGTDIGVVGRSVGTSNGYRMRLKMLSTGVIRASLISVWGSTTTLTQVNVPGVTYGPGTQIRVRMQVEGTSPTTLRGKVWLAGTTEPAAWTMTATDTTPELQVAGGIGFTGYMATSTTNAPQTVRVDDVWSGPLGGFDGPVDPPANQAPEAAFTATPAGLGVNVDGTGSSDPDGTVASYAWQFGDGGTATGPTASHTYAAAGTYTVTLTVTDDDDATDSTTRSVTVTAPGDPVVLASDTFTRLVTGGWGAADTGGDWTLVGGAANFAVDGTGGTMRVSNPGWHAQAYLTGVSQTEADVTATITLDKLATGSGTDIGIVGRSIGTSDGYRMRMKMLSTGVIRASLIAVDGSTVTLTQVNVPGMTYAAGTPVNVRLQVVGTAPTTLRGKVWLAGTAEPAGWLMTATDSTAALQVAGGVGLTAYVSTNATNAPQTVRLDDLRVSPPA